MALLRRHIKPEEWKPAGIDALEDNALDVVRSPNNRSVIAGPGSGKTELLAQRASFLLQCGISARPQRILAVSYKRDAAFNIAKRVTARCHPEQAHRFDSFTIDAFAKSLVDRFGQALPPEWRPTPDYEIARARDPIVRDFLRSLAPPASVGTYADIMAITVKGFEKQWVVPLPLASRPVAKLSPGVWAADQFWDAWLRRGPRSFLTFAMIGRLAEHLVRTNPMVRQALQLTYSHLFMDEFQDTTQVQYDLVKAVFLGSQTVITAVGDNKQQIMRFAMAMDDPFTPYEADFQSQRTPLKNNYRSSPDLVRIQDILARAIDMKTITPVSKSAAAITGNSCEVWDFQSVAAEATYLAANVASEMTKYGLKPRDFCILVRLRAAEYMKILEPAFAAQGGQLRNEAEMIGEVALQELLGEAVSEIVVALLRVATAPRAGRYWSDCLEALCFMRGLALDDDAARAKIATALEKLSVDFAAARPAPAASQAEAEAVVTTLLDFVGYQSIVSTSPAYRQGDWLEHVVAAVILHLEASSRGAATWSEALDIYEGEQAVPLMTIHKSKGLEYHTVMFVGLDDGAWFAFQSQTKEEMCGFFVAFTRAKQRVIFSYCAARGQRTAIAPLYTLLKSASVQTVAH
ncbi:ATP-dependent helicase [Bradyrhizobium sp. 15]|uniref:UvrD-helicase domain-containing protein n=1 Tax=Bradyrhizobium sp. 15 TaxID=2782633 RepID=UPI001FF95858|nr:ATP-dependent helicase [Bradyrhizobium sp. 15]MCK1440450.1 ATP-dependent helicase [Bradyrhizobium sp. 15]